MTNNTQRDTNAADMTSGRDQGQQQGSNKNQAHKNLVEKGTAGDHHGLGSSGAGNGGENNRGEGNNISSSSE